jgi:hypothetical protein
MSVRWEGARALSTPMADPWAERQAGLERQRQRAREDGARDARLGQQPTPWPWDDGHLLEASYLEGYVGL